MTDRSPVLRTFDLLPGELVVDNFAGGGGASTGIERALGRPVDIAINHDPVAIAMHKANHPETRHFVENIWEVDPKEACGSRPVGLAWFSPDCTHFSRAKGSQPLKKEIRGLAWVVVRWARAVAPRVIIVENVEEFCTWGPLTEDNRPDPAKVGETFREWLSELAACGYQVEFKSLVAADYGAPTTRRRLFLVARRDGQRVVFPDPTHGRGTARSWRPASEVIDWSLPTRSIFGRRRPLADATLRRIAVGIRKYVLESASPFIIPVTHQGADRVHGIEEPVRTITAAHRGEPSLVEPFIVRHGHYSHRTGAGLREGCGAGLFRGQQLGRPLGTVCATNDKHLVCPVIISQYGRSVGREVAMPLPTVTAGGGGHHALLASIVSRHYTGVVGQEVSRPLGTVTARDHHALTSFLLKYYGTSSSADVGDPMPTITAGGGHGGGHIAEVRAFLLKYYNGGGGRQELDDPLHTVTGKARFGLVTVAGVQYRIADIGMRMLQPHELFLAQGFPESYDISPQYAGKPLTKTRQIALVGNSVCPPVAEAIVLANARQSARGAA